MRPQFSGSTFLLLAGVLPGIGQLCSAQIYWQAQPETHQTLTVSRDAQGQRESMGRFLGWKYAAVAHQDTSRWTHDRRNTDFGESSQTSARESTSASRRAAASASAAQTFSYAGFAAPVKLPTGFLPTAVAQGDFNGDGKLDLAISNGGDNTIYVYLGDGDATFAVPEVLYTKGQSPVWLAAAQLRTNGPLDLIAVDGDSKQVEVFFGNGDGTFQPGTIVASLAQTPSFLLAGDFNNDGHTDLAIGLVVDADSTEPQFEILLGDGTGAFPSTLTPPLVSGGSGPLPTSWLAAGDVNKDGYLDLVATVAFAGAITYLNHGGTGFTQGAIFNPSDTATAVALGDMHGSGCLDAIEAGAYGYLTIAKGNCDGTFTQSNPTAELGDVDVALAAVDVNGDGNLDVIASSAYSDGEEVAGVGAYGGYLVSVLDGDGAGEVTPAAMYRVGPDAYSLTVADLKGDSRPDIITISQSESTASQLENDGSGRFGAPSGETIGYLSGVTNAPLPSGTTQTVDVNGDGKPDVVLIEFGENSTYPSDVTVLLNDGTGKLEPPIRSPITVGPNLPYPLFVAAKFRSSSPADLIYISEYESYVVAFMPGNGDGTFGAPVTLATLPDPRAVVAGDFNGDGNLDFAVLGFASVNSQSTVELDVFLGNGNGTFQHLQPQTFAAPNNGVPAQLRAGDFNHDGKLDLLFGFSSNTNADLDLALGSGNGTFQAPKTLMANFGPVAVADLNNDGYLDLVQSKDPNASITEGAVTAAGGPFSAAAVTVYLGGPGGTFTQQAPYTAPGLLGGTALVGDFNGDGNPDIAIPYLQATIGRPWERRLQIFQGNGDGTFAVSGIPYQLPAYDLPVIGGNYRGLGVTDLLDLVGSTSSINTISAAPAPALALTADSSPLTGSQGSATVTLALPATASQTVQLTSSDPAVTLPGSLTLNAGQLQQSFTFTLGSGFDASHLLAISATLSGQTATAYFAEANANLHPGVTALIGGSTKGTTSVGTSPGGSIPLLLTLESISGYSGIFGDFTCSDLPGGAQCDFAQPNVTLLAGGYAQVAFDLSTTSATPLGTYNLVIGASNTELSPSVPLTLGIGGVSLSANPTIIQVNGATAPAVTVAATYTNGFSQNVQLNCTGLPAGAACVIPSILYPASPSTTVTLTAASSVAAQDYPFQIVGSTENFTTQAGATLRVSSFSASLQTSTLTVTNDQSATVNVQLSSLNHFSNTGISLSCQTTANVSCTPSTPHASLTDGGTTTVALTVHPSLNFAAVRSRNGTPWSVAMACLLAFVLPLRRRANRRPRFLGFLILFALLGAATSCGGNGTGGSGGGNRGGTGGGGSSNSQTISVSVSAEATTGSAPLQVPAGTLTVTVTQ